VFSVDCILNLSIRGFFTVTFGFWLSSTQSEELGSPLVGWHYGATFLSDVCFFDKEIGAEKFSSFLEVRGRASDYCTLRRCCQRLDGISRMVESGVTGFRLHFHSPVEIPIEQNSIWHSRSPWSHKYLNSVFSISPESRMAWVVQSYRACYASEKSMWYSLPVANPDISGKSVQSSMGEKASECLVWTQNTLVWWPSLCCCVCIEECWPSYGECLWHPTVLSTLPY